MREQLRARDPEDAADALVAHCLGARGGARSVAVALLVLKPREQLLDPGPEASALALADKLGPIDPGSVV